MTDTPALYFACRSAIAAGSVLTFGSGGFRTPLLSPKELKALRREAALDGCQYVNGKTGMTVFRFGGCGMTASRQRRYYYRKRSGIEVFQVKANRAKLEKLLIMAGILTDNGRNDHDKVCLALEIYLLNQYDFNA